MPDLYNAQFTRFEHPMRPDRSFDEWAMVPVHYIREWQSPKNGNGQADFRTVRISEHRWPHKSTFLCRGGGADLVEWPEPPPPADRNNLMTSQVLVPWQWFPECTGEPILEMDDAAWRVHDAGWSGQNDGLPEDYLDFWLESDSCESEDSHA
jgi:hypothetical protein